MIGNIKPVTLVKSVVNRNSAVSPGMRCAPTMPKTTTMPLAIAISVMMTWTAVNVAIERPRIIHLHFHLKVRRGYFPVPC